MRFKLRDLFALTLVAAVLMPVIIRAIVVARERSRMNACANNLRAVGVSMFTFSTADPASRHCSGAPDFLRDGCIDTFGWVADVINSGMVSPNELIDPSNPLRGTDTLEDMLTKDPSQRDPNGVKGRSSSGVCGRTIWMTLSGDQSTYFAGTLSGSNRRAELISRAFVSRGYNTNYAASWVLVRGRVKTSVTGSGLYTDPQFTDFLSVNSATGPLTTNVMDRSRVSSSNVVVLGCAGSSGRPLSRDIGHDPTGIWGLNDGETTVYAQSGDLLAHGFSAGPAFWNQSSKQVELISGGSLVGDQLMCERNEPTTNNCLPPTGISVSGNDTYLQDTRAWQTVHAGRVNMLMCDASIKSFEDLNGDGLVNPGFPVKNTVDRERRSYVDDRRELAPIEYFGGLFINDLRQRLLF